ncbi:hypothetical protein OZX60_05830 [Streptococcaceae bacterium ESL0687]|nr:hypothetical protein OZX60_05830 [Streptococcaceae bacterium ESL0687]
MVTVTQRLQEVKQPRGGYLPVKNFIQLELSSGQELSDKENISPGLVGIVVDYLTRFMDAGHPEKSFKISLYGARILGSEEEDKAQAILKNIKGLDDQSIAAACKLAGYDTVYRAGKAGFVPIEEIKPDEATISNIRIMVERSLDFIKKYGPVTEEGFRFDGAYTSTITNGDGDFLTKDTLWDFKVSKNKPTSKNTLQLAIYYLMGKHSRNLNFADITKLGIFNPRLNLVYLLDINSVDDKIFSEIEELVIGY